MKMKFRSDHFIMIMNNSSGEFRSRELRKERGLAPKNIFISLAGFSLLQFGLKIRREGLGPLGPSPRYAND